MTSPVTNVSDTARWVAVYRAMESERPDAHFRDPWAKELAGTQGHAIVDHMAKGRSLAWPMIVRTVVFDELITRSIAQHGVDTVLNLAAGLDTRPYRLSFPRPVRWFDADLPEILSYRDSILAGEEAKCERESVHVDLTDPTARRGLFERVGNAGKNVLTLSEGLLIYLTSEDVAALARDLHEQSSLHYWILDLAGPGLIKRLARTWGKQLAESNAAFRFAPAEGSDFFAPHGWIENEYHSIFEESIRLNRTFRFAKFWRMVGRLYPKKKQEEFHRMSGIVLLERAER